MRKKIVIAFLISFSVCILLACGNTGSEIDKKTEEEPILAGEAEEETDSEEQVEEGSKEEVDLVVDKEDLKEVSETEQGYAAEMKNVYYDFFMQKEYGNIIEPRVSIYSEEYLTFCFFDLGQDGMPELIIHDGGASMAEMTNYVFSYHDGAVEFVGELGSRESTMKYAPGSDYYGVFCLSGNNGILDALYYSISDGKLVEEAVLEGELDYDKNLGEDILISIRQLTEDDDLYEAYFNANEEVKMYSAEEINNMGWEHFIADK